jgi:hypothetical protein
MCLCFKKDLTSYTRCSDLRLKIKWKSKFLFHQSRISWCVQFFCRSIKFLARITTSVRGSSWLSISLGLQDVTVSGIRPAIDGEATVDLFVSSYYFARQQYHYSYHLAYLCNFIAHKSFLTPVVIHKTK